MERPWYAQGFCLCAWQMTTSSAPQVVHRGIPLSITQLLPTPELLTPPRGGDCVHRSSVAFARGGRQPFPALHCTALQGVQKSVVRDETQLLFAAGWQHLKEDTDSKMT